MGEKCVNGIVFEVVEVITLSHLVGDQMNLGLFEGWVARELGRVSVAEIREDNSQILPCRVALDPNLLTEGLRLSGLLRALPIRPKLPAVVATPDLIALYPTHSELRSPMCTAKVHQVRVP
jgi:hypothetical protein